MWFFWSINFPYFLKLLYLGLMTTQNRIQKSNCKRDIRSFTFRVDNNQNSKIENNFYASDYKKPFTAYFLTDFL